MAKLNLNSLTAVIGIIVTAVFAANGVEIDTSAGDIAKAILTKEGLGILSYLVMQFGAPIWKTIVRIKNQGYNWGVIKSRNFALHTAAGVTVVLTQYFDQAVAGYIGAMLIEAVNLGWHLIERKK